MVMVCERLLSLLSLLLLLLLLPRNPESLQFSSNRRSFVVNAATSVFSTAAITFGGHENVANAAIDVSGLRVESSSRPQQSGARGVDPGQLKSGPLAGTKLGFQVGGGPRPEEVVRAIDEPRYEAARKAQGLGPAFLEGVPREAQPEKIQNDFKRMR